MPIARRDFMLGAAGVAALAAMLIETGTAVAASPTAAEALSRILGDAKPVDAKITFDLPEIAENGNTVPFTLSVESPMTPADYVKALHIVAPGNPLPDVVSFLFTPESGKASVSSRMRLGGTQDVVAVAEMSNGTFYSTKRTVKVTIGGCGG